MKRRFGAGLEERLDDKRAKERLASISEKLAQNPSASFPNVFLNASELEGAYRFFANAAVTPDAILADHFAATKAASLRESVLIVHDSTTFTFDPAGARRGLGRKNSEGQAFFGHFALVISDDGQRRPLGLAAVEPWVRDEARELVGERRRWVETVKTTRYRLGSAEAIHVMDREADDYSLFSALMERGERFVIRVSHDRKLETAVGSARLLHAAAASLEADIERTVKLSKRVDGARSAKMKQVNP